MLSHRALLAGSLVAGLCAAATRAEASPLVGGRETNDVVGQLDFTHGYAADALSGAHTPAANTFFVPSDIAVDASHDRAFVADMHNHRIMVIKLASTVQQAAASFVLGQPDFTTGGAYPDAPYGGKDTPNPAWGCAAGVNACGLKRAWSVSYDDANQRLFVADTDNHRIMMWSLAGGISNGMAAAGVLGQPSFTTSTQRTACGGGSTGTVDACGMSAPSDVAIDTAGQRLFVADTQNHRVLVFDVATGLTSGMAATMVLGQGSLTTKTVMRACPTAAATAASACGMSSPGSLSWDPLTHRLYVADNGAHRVLVFDLSAGVTTGMAATAVIGQPNLQTGTADTACGGGGSGTVNRCGLGIWPLGLDLDQASGRLLVSDAANSRVLVFDVATLVNGVIAQAVLGQPDFSHGYDGASPTWGGATSRTRLLSPFGLAVDSLNDRILVADGGNHRVVTYGANVGGRAVTIRGDVAQVTSSVGPGGAVTIDIVDALGDAFSVTLPAGTAPRTGDIAIAFDNPSSRDRAAITVDANLPNGAAETVSLPAGPGTQVCILDRAGATLEMIASCTARDRYLLPAAGSCARYRISNDTGPGGFHNVDVCRASAGNTVSLTGLRHSGVGAKP